MAQPADDQTQGYTNDDNTQSQIQPGSQKPDASDEINKKMKKMQMNDDNNNLANPNAQGQEAPISSTVTTDEGTKKKDEQEESKLPPKMDVTLSLRGIPEFDQFPFKKENKRFYFMASIKAPFFREDKRAPIDLVAVVDESGSMGGPRIDLVRETVMFIIENMESGDRFGLVGYADNARTILPLTTMDSHGKEKAQSLAKKLQASGQTALCAGLVRGVEMMRKRKVCNDVASVLILTDGQANVGPSSANGIISAVVGGRGGGGKVKKQKLVQKRKMKTKNKRMSSPSTKNNDEQKQVEGAGIDLSESGLPCTINTFGFGSGHNESLLEAISEAGRGMYAFIENTEGIADTFAECLGGLVSIVGQNLKIKIEALNDVIINKCLSKGYALKIEKKNKIYTVTINNIQSEENRDLVFELALPVVKAMKEKDPIIQISVNYKNVVKDTQEVLSTVCGIDRIDGEQIGERNIELDVQYNRVVAAEAMDQADELANAGKLQEARKVLSEASVKIQKSKSNKNEYSQNLVRDIQVVGENLKSKQQYRQKGGKMLKMNKKAHYMQRSVQSSNYASQSAYQNKSKSSMKRKFKKKK